MKEKTTRGRKPLSDKEKKVAVTIWVKGKYAEKATNECIKIQNKYEQT
jgi:hypothetical protein